MRIDAELHEAGGGEPAVLVCRARWRTPDDRAAVGAAQAAARKPQDKSGRCPPVAHGGGLCFMHGAGIEGAVRQPGIELWRAKGPGVFGRLQVSGRAAKRKGGRRRGDGCDGSWCEREATGVSQPSAGTSFCVASGQEGHPGGAIPSGDRSIARIRAFSPSISADRQDASSREGTASEARSGTLRTGLEIVKGAGIWGAGFTGSFHVRSRVGLRASG